MISLSDVKGLRWKPDYEFDLSETFLCFSVGANRRTGIFRVAERLFDRVFWRRIENRNWSGTCDVSRSLKIRFSFSVILVLLISNFEFKTVKSFENVEYM